MECTGEKNFPASRRENGFFEVWPVRPNFFLFTKGDCTCFKVIFSEQNQNLPTCKSNQSHDDGFLEDFLAVRLEIGSLKSVFSGLVPLLTLILVSSLLMTLEWINFLLI